jgi:hypothetical protein
MMTLSLLTKVTRPEILAWTLAPRLPEGISPIRAPSSTSPLPEQLVLRHHLYAASAESQLASDSFLSQF